MCLFRTGLGYRAERKEAKARECGRIVAHRNKRVLGGGSECNFQ